MWSISYRGLKTDYFVFSALLADFSERWFFKVSEVFFYFKVMIYKNLAVAFQLLFLPTVGPTHKK